MTDIRDFELLKAGDPIDPEPRAGRGVWIALVVLIVAAAIAAYIVYGRRPAPAPAQTAKAEPAAAAPARPLGGDADKIDVPPLRESDPLVRELVRKLTSNPTALAWLATDGLIRNFTVVVGNVGEGVTPTRHLGALRPAAPFKVIDRGGELVIDPRSYDRYNGVADAVASIDPQGAARLYATLKPRIEEAYGELGEKPASFDAALERAIVALLRVPVVDGPIRVEPKGGTDYQYADPNLEKLTAAQKHLLRTGPRNVRAIHSALRQMALALGIPSERLPQ
jgi:hypothetical protein